MTKYRVQVDDKTYSVEIEALSNMKEEVKTSEDIFFQLLCPSMSIVCKGQRSLTIRYIYY